MFPKGTKRKFLDSAEDAATAAAAGEQGPASARTPSPSYSLQRQSLLDMSLIKLQLCHMLVEPNLCRSVLIANTVRQIQEEMTQDGTWQIMTQALAAAQCPTDRLVATEVLCRQSDPAAAAGQSPKPYPLVGGLDRGYHSEEVVMEAGDAHKEALPTQSYLAGPFGMGPCWEEEQQQQEEEEEDDDDEEEEDGGGGGGGEEDEDGEESDGEDADERPEVDSRPGEQVFGTFEIKQQQPPPPPPPDPALEELFSDVDPSYYELDTVLTGMQSAPKMGPYDLLESLSSHGPQPLSPGASCRSDLNELDHIMEIIVGS